MRDWKCLILSRVVIIQKRPTGPACWGGLDSFAGSWPVHTFPASSSTRQDSCTLSHLHTWAALRRQVKNVGFGQMRTQILNLNNFLKDEWVVFTSNFPQISHLIKEAGWYICNLLKVDRKLCRQRLAYRLLHHKQSRWCLGENIPIPRISVTLLVIKAPLT